VLSRTADHVYWLGRYVERAENLARALDVQYRLSLLPQPTQSVAAGWLDTLDELGLLEAYRERYGEVYATHPLQFIAFDREALTSIYGCLRAARENARAVRGAITSEMWETLNATWLEARALDVELIHKAALGEFIDWVKYRSQLLRGVVAGTMLRDEAYSFIAIGSSLERGDGTARILGARLATASGGRGAGSYYQWSVLLRAMSAFENYRKLFRDAVAPERVAELLVLREDDPRSLRRSVAELYTNLLAVASEQSHEVKRRAGELDAQLRFGQIDSLVARGLRSFLDEFVERLRDIDHRISMDFLSRTRSSPS
jgi:uncharacterized alpha-E superfamily protein